MKRRIKALLLAMLMVVSVLVVDVPHVHASEGGFSVSANKVVRGETFTVDFVIPAQEELGSSLDAYFLFDNSTFELKSLTAAELDGMDMFKVTDVDDANESGEYGVFAFYYSSNGFSLASAYTISAEFGVKQAAAKGKYEFVADTVLLYDVNESIAYEVEDTSVSVEVVIPANSVKIKDENLNEFEELVLQEESETKLIASITPADSSDTVVWSSDNETVATVDANGKVTAVKAGTATITATAGSVSDTCEVTVTCAHKNVTSYEEVAATCTEDGKKAYSLCECGVCLVDGEEVDASALVIEALGHEFTTYVAKQDATCTANGTKEYHKCTRCNAISLDGESECTEEDLVITSQGHQYGEQVADDYLVSVATCTESAVYNKSCTVCGEEHESETFESGDPLGHDLKYYERVEAGCTTAGNIEYWYCEECEEYFKDEDATIKTNESGVVISATGHDKEEDTEYSSDAEDHWKACGCGNIIVDKQAHQLVDKTDETYHWEECSVCGKELNKEAHVYDQQNAEADYLKSVATCENAAVYYKSCSCGYESTTDTFETQALGHDFTGNIIPAIAPTCTEDGKYAYYECQRDNCSAISKDGTDVCTEEELVDSKLGHNLIKTEASDPTCTEEGNSAYWTCQRTECQKHYSDEEAENEITDLSTTVIAATGHSSVEATAWTTDGVNHWKVCTNTGCNEVIVLAASHDLEMKYDETHHWELCETCGYTTEKEEHVGGSATCLEKATCEVCAAKYDDIGSHNWIKGTTYLKSEATCEDAAVYYMLCSVCNKQHETDTFEYGDALGHDYELQDEVSQTCEDEGTKEHYACTRCDAVSLDGNTECTEEELVIQADGHVTVYTSAVAPTCTTSGNNAYWQCQTEGCGKYFEEAAATTELTWDEDIYLEELGHTASDSWTKDESNHWKECVRCDSANITDKDSHDFEMQSNETHHWKECTVCGYTTTEEQHAGGTATCIKLAECGTCSKEYGSFAACTYAEVEADKYVKTEATCEGEGEYYKSCTVCGEAHATETFETDALGHDYELQAEVPETCEGEGTKEHYACTRCDAVSFDKVDKCEASELVIPAAGHEYDEVEAEAYVITEATCEAKGEYYKSCTVCGKAHATETFETDALGHDYELQAEVPETCEGEGTKEHYACTRCDAVSFDKVDKCEASELVIPAAGHEYDEVVAEEYLVSEATCIAKAVYKVSCTVCDEAHETETFETGDVNADNHAGEIELRDVKEAKCYEYGYTGDTYCLDCGVLVEEGEQIDKLAHNITTWEVVKEPTTTEEGLKVGYCEYKAEGCTEEQYVTLAKLVAVGEEIQVETDGEVTVESVIVSSESNVNEDVILQIEDVTDELSEAELAAVETAAQQLEEVDDEAEVLTIFDIHLLIREMSESGEVISESEFDLEGSVELKIQLSEEFVNNYENIVLIHVKDDGSIEVIPYTIDENNVVTFTAKDFSYYAFVGTEKEEDNTDVDTDVDTDDDSADNSTDNSTNNSTDNKDNPNTGDTAPILLWLTIAILAMGTAIVSKTKKQR